jgi:hypothetical protein
MSLYRDSIARISVLQARVLTGVAPRIFKTLGSITLSHGVDSVEVKLLRTRGHGCVDETTVFECPRCRSTARVLAFSYVGIGCMTCMPWRSREYAVSRRQSAPHVGTVTAIP